MGLQCEAVALKSHAAIAHMFASDGPLGDPTSGELQWIRRDAMKENPALAGPLITTWDDLDRVRSVCGAAVGTEMPD